MRWRSGLLTASSVLLLVACGGHEERPAPAPPRIPAAVASRLAAEADSVAALRGCSAHAAAARFRADLIASIGEVPARYQEPLTSAANSLAARIAPCPQPVATPKPDEHDDEHDKEHREKKDKHDG